MKKKALAKILNIEFPESIPSSSLEFIVENNSELRKGSKIEIEVTDDARNGGINQGVVIRAKKYLDGHNKTWFIFLTLKVEEVYE